MRLAYDKKLHFGAGLLIAILAGLLFNSLYGLALAIVAGIGKEIYDYFDYGKPDVTDAIATWIGGVVGYMVMVLL